MKKKNTVFIIIYMLLLTAPSLSMPFFFNGKNSEKRELASFPTLYAEGKINADFSEQLNDFFNDRIGFRSYLVGANTVVRKNLFGQSAVEKVIIGKKGWLFFNDTLSDYQRTDLLSERNINNAVRTVEMMNEYLKDRDIAFVFTIIPNKNTLYPEYMKSGYKRNSASSDMERIAEKIKHTDVAYADVYNAIKAYDRVLYQRTDSHWTYEGALVGYRCIMDSSGTDYNHFDSVSFERRKDWDSDLGEMLYSEFAPKDYQDYPDLNFNYEIVSREKEPDALSLKTENEYASGNAFIFRDSFMNTGYIYFAENFQSASFSRSYPFNFEKIEEDTDIVVLEIVERNIENIASKAPLMAAEKTDEELEIVEIPNDSFKIFMEKKNSLYHVYGYISDDCLSEYSRIILENDNGFYEAFPVYEKELLDEKLSDNGFSIYFSEEPKELSEIRVFLTKQ